MKDLVKDGRVIKEKSGKRDWSFLIHAGVLCHNNYDRSDNILMDMWAEDDWNGIIFHISSEMLNDASLFQVGDLIVQAMEAGERKGYGRDSWLLVPPAEYKAACARHLDAHFRGELVDPSDGKPHLAGALFACYAMLVHKKIGESRE